MNFKDKAGFRRDKRAKLVQKQQEQKEALRLQKQKQEQATMVAQAFPDLKILNSSNTSVSNSSSRTVSSLFTVGSMFASNVFYNAGDESKYVIESYNADDQRFTITGPGITSSSYLDNMRVEDGKVKISTKWKDVYVHETNTRSTMVWQKSNEPNKKRIWWSPECHKEYTIKKIKEWTPIWSDGKQFPLTWAHKTEKEIIWNLENIDKMCGMSDIEPEEAKDDEAIDGLKQWLTDLKLDKYYEECTKWVTENGASSIDEIRENYEDFAAALKLKKLEVTRLSKHCGTPRTITSGAQGIKIMEYFKKLLKTFVIG